MDPKMDHTMSTISKTVFKFRVYIVELEYSIYDEVIFKSKKHT